MGVFSFSFSCFFIFFFFFLKFIFCFSLLVLAWILLTSLTAPVASSWPKSSRLCLLI